MSLALFDFDGTITSRDSLEDFIQFAVGKRRYYWGLIKLGPILMSFFLRIIPNHIAKQRLLNHFFDGWDYAQFCEVAQKYSTESLPRIIRPAAMQRIQWHRQQGHRIIIVSASLHEWLQAWCEQHELELIATRLKIKDGKITGWFDGKNCHGEEKVRRIQQIVDLSQYPTVYAYGDSRGDHPMLALAQHAYYRYFN